MINYDDEDYIAAREALIDGDLDTTRSILKRMLAGNPDSLEATELCGDLAHAMGDVNKAERLYLKLAKLSDDPLTQATSQLSRGILASELRQHDQAKALLGAAAEAFGEMGVVNQQALALGNLGTACLDACDLLKAEDVLLQAIDCYTECEDFDAVALVCADLACAYRMMGRLQQAEEMFHRAMDMFETLGEQIHVASCLDGLGIIHQVRSEYEQAETMHQAAVAINQ